MAFSASFFQTWCHSRKSCRNYANVKFWTSNIKLKFFSCQTICNAHIILSITQTLHGVTRCNFEFAYFKFLEIYFCSKFIVYNSLCCYALEGNSSRLSKFFSLFQKHDSIFIAVVQVHMICIYTSVYTSYCIYTHCIYVQ